jgi:tetratricopeptide (TPR) repeat protein
MKQRLLKYYFKFSVTLCFLFFLSPTVLAQEQRVADSLRKIYTSGKFLSSSEKMELLRNLSFNEVDNSALGMKYAEELIAYSKAEKNYLYLHRGYYQKGNKHRISGDLDVALAAFFKSTKAAEKASYTPGLGTAYSAIADVYSVMGNTKNAEIYYTIENT